MKRTRNWICLQYTSHRHKLLAGQALSKYKAHKPTWLSIHECRFSIVFCSIKAGFSFLGNVHLPRKAGLWWWSCLSAVYLRTNMSDVLKLQRNSLSIENVIVIARCTGAELQLLENRKRWSFTCPKQDFVSLAYRKCFIFFVNILDMLMNICRSVHCLSVVEQQ